MKKCSANRDITSSTALLLDDFVIDLVNASQHCVGMLSRLESIFGESIDMPASKIFASCDDAVADVFDGATVMIGGFGSFGGLPVHLIEALAKQGAKELTIMTVAPSKTSATASSQLAKILLAGISIGSPKIDSNRLESRHGAAWRAPDRERSHPSMAL